MTGGKAIPILPCPDIRQQVQFYQLLGFELLGLYTAPNPYAALQWGDISLHFYGTRKVQPAANASMCFLSVGDVDAVYAAFAGALKQHMGRVPRTGIPRISKVRDLAGDRRFTLTDTGGNTIFVGTPVKPGSAQFFRTLQNEAWAQRFAALYDVVYSKEDARLAADMLPRYAAALPQLNDLDKAKYYLVVQEIRLQLNQPPDDGELKALLAANKGKDWQRVRERYRRMLEEL